MVRAVKNRFRNCPGARAMRNRGCGPGLSGWQRGYMNFTNELNMLVSGVFDKDNKKQACVYFTQGDSFAEGYIPDCKITSSKGFTEQEIAELEGYMMDNLPTLKHRASEINPIKAMMKD